MAGVLLVVSSVCGFSLSADDFKGEKTLGLKVGYNTYNVRPVAGVQFSYRFNRWLRISPDIEYVFRNHGVDALAVDVNVHFLFPVAGSRLNLFPLIGGNFSSWNFHPDKHVYHAAGGNDGKWETNDVSTRSSKFGLNVGAGMDFSVSGSLSLSVSGVYTVIERFHGANIMAGIHYRF